MESLARPCFRSRPLSLPISSCVTTSPCASAKGNGKTRARSAPRDVSESDRLLPFLQRQAAKECNFPFSLHSALLSRKTLRESTMKTYRAATGAGVGAHADAGLESESHGEEVRSAGGRVEKRGLEFWRFSFGCERSERKPVDFLFFFFSHSLESLTATGPSLDSRAFFPFLSPCSGNLLTLQFLSA